MPNSELMHTPVARFVSGSLTEKRTTDHLQKPIDPEKQQYEIGVAIRKDDPNIGAVFTAIQQHAWQEFSKKPHVQTIVQAFDLDRFSWKIADGDKPNRQGAFNENTKGHWVFYFKSSYPINCCDARNVQCDPALIKRGHFVDLAFTVAGNDLEPPQAGVYLNPVMVRHVAHGQEIVGGITPDQAFGNRPVPAQLPPGASATPVAAGPMPGAMPGNGHASGGMPQSTVPAGMPASGAPASTTGPSAMPSTSPSNGMPGNAAPGGNMPSTTGYPGSVPPNTNFANGPQG